jgi:hypothetical protein
MKNMRGALVGIGLLLACAHHLPAQSTDPNAGGETLLPEAVNLDIPPQVVADPEQIQQQELAVQALQQPEAFHEWLLQLHPERRAIEQLAALALLHPDAFRRLFPETPDQIRADAIAAHAILNPHFPIPSGSN